MKCLAFQSNNIYNIKIKSKLLYDNYYKFLYDKSLKKFILKKKKPFYLPIRIA
jgi:hypothetical protein